MSFDQLWAGWRSEYVTSVSTPDEVEDDADTGAEAEEAKCVFCRIVADNAPDAERGVIAETSLSIAMLNAYPYASGHVLVMPRRHVRELADLAPDESADLWQLTLDSAAAIGRAYEPDGMNIGANLGRAAGAGIPKHLHLHLVPRWIGDTNFMTSVAGVRVLPEALPTSWERLRAAWSQ